METTERVIVARTLTAHDPETPNSLGRPAYVIGRFCLHSIGGQAPYFSATGEIWESEGWARNGQEARMIAGGAITEDLARLFPEALPVIRLHLARADGTPMHAVANGWYVYSGACERYERERVARGETWHAKELEVPRLERVARILRVPAAEIPARLDEDGFSAFCETLAPRWQAEADAALAWLEGANDARR